MLKSANVATPPTAGTVRVPLSVAAAEPVPGMIATVTDPLKPVAVFPKASWAVTWMAGLMTTNRGVVLGWTPKTRPTASPGVMLNAGLVAAARPVAVAGYGKHPRGVLY